MKTCDFITHFFLHDIIMTHCRFILPIEGVGLIIWWVVEEIVTNSSTWWLIETDTLATTLMEWAIILLIFIGLNWWMGPLKIYEPKDRFSRTVLGLIFKLTPRRKFHSSEDKTVFVTPDAVRTYSSICFNFCMVILNLHYSYSFFHTSELSCMAIYHACIATCHVSK